MENTPGSAVSELVKSYASTSCLINMEPTELLHIQPSDPIASEGVILPYKLDTYLIHDYSSNTVSSPLSMLHFPLFLDGINIEPHTKPLKVGQFSKHSSITMAYGKMLRCTKALGLARNE